MANSLARSISAVLAGIVVTVALSIGTDMLMERCGVLPPFGQPPPDAALAVALVYRTLYGVLGAYLIARLAPNRPMGHALLCGYLGFAVAAAGAIATWNAGPAYGAKWYALALIATAIPGAWAGGKLYRPAVL